MTEPAARILMRQRDRLPLISLAIEDDYGAPLDLTTATAAELSFRMVDGSQLFPSGYPWSGNDWWVRPVLIADKPNGVVTYDWQDDEAQNVGVGVIELAVTVRFQDGRQMESPTDGHAYLVMRQEVFPRPGAEPMTYGADQYGTGNYGDPTPRQPI